MLVEVTVEPPPVAHVPELTTVVVIMELKPPPPPPTVLVTVLEQSVTGPAPLVLGYSVIVDVTVLPDPMAVTVVVPPAAQLD